MQRSDLASFGTPRLRGSPVPLPRQALIFIAPPRAAPSPPLAFRHQTRLHWIVLRVTNRPFQMLPIADERVEILPFPESSAAIERQIHRARATAFPKIEQLRERRLPDLHYEM